MVKGKGKQVSFAVADGPSASHLYKGFEPDASLREVPIQPKLDCSAEALGEDKELWLIQLPLQLDPSKPLTWQVDQSTGEGRLRAHCSVDGVSYELVSDRDATSLPLYVTPGGQRGKLPRVVRRVTVLRVTQAPQICFGAGEDHLYRMQAPTQPPSPDQLPPGDPAAVAKRKSEVRKLQPAPVAATIGEPRQAVLPSAAEDLPTKSSLAAHGGGQQAHQQPPAAAAVAGEAGREQGQEKKKGKKKRKVEEEEAVAAEPARHGAKSQGSPEKKAKKDKAKKEKKAKKDKP